MLQKQNNDLQTENKKLLDYQKVLESKNQCAKKNYDYLNAEYESISHTYFHALDEINDLKERYENLIAEMKQVQQQYISQIKTII